DMELLIFFFGALYLFGFVIAGTILAVGCAAIVALALIVFVIRFWYAIFVTVFTLFLLMLLIGSFIWLLEINVVLGLAVAVLYGYFSQILRKYLQSKGWINNAFAD
ncbi:hypothetical protein, partial [Avibacterium paragallinarum]